MAAKPNASRRGVQQPVRICKAVRGNLGRVIRGAEITEREAVLERLAGHDIVVCGGGFKANRALAHKIESQVGLCKEEPAHTDIRPYALPHFQPDPRPPEGHAFFETSKVKAAKNP